MVKFAFSYNIVRSNRRLHVVEYIPSNTNYSVFQKVIKVPNVVSDVDYNAFLLNEIKAFAPHNLWLLESIAESEMPDVFNDIVTSGFIALEDTTPNRPTPEQPVITSRPVVIKDI